MTETVGAWGWACGWFPWAGGKVTTGLERVFWEDSPGSEASNLLRQSSPDEAERTSTHRHHGEPAERPGLPTANPESFLSPRSPGAHPHPEPSLTQLSDAAVAWMAPWDVPGSRLVPSEVTASSQESGLYPSWTQR